MDNGCTPGLAPSLALLTGAVLAQRLELGVGSGGAVVPMVAILVALGCAWGRRPGKLVALVAAGALLVWCRPQYRDDCLASLDTSRPVHLTGELATPWRASDWGWRAELSVERARQGPLVLRCRGTVALSSGSREVTGLGFRRSIRVKGFLRRSEAWRNAAAERLLDEAGPRRLRMYVKSPAFVMPAAGGWWVAEGGGLASALSGLGAGARGWVRRCFTGVEKRPGVRAAQALLLGDKNSLDSDFRRSLRRFGLSHLFAVSGLHVALLSMMVHAILRGVPHRPRLAMTAVSVLGYLVLVGARPSIIRATAMFCLALVAVSLERPPHARQALCLAAVALGLMDPRLLSSLAYQLTVSATAGILWLAPVLESRWTLGPRALRSGMAATVAAQVGSLPWAVSSFSLLFPLAPLINLVAIPWMAVFALASFTAAAVMGVAPTTRPLLASALDLGLEPLAWLDALPPSPWLTLPVALGFGEACLLAGGLLAIALAGRMFLRMAGLAVVVVLLRGPALPEVAEVIALDVGQGDSILLHDGRSTVLIDGGGWRSGDIAAAVLVPALARLGVRRLSAAVVTHPDVDHCRGLLDLSYYLPIETVVTASAAGGAQAAPCIRSLVSRPRTRWLRLWSGRTARIGRLHLESLHPEAGSRGSDNDSSLVLRAVVGTSSVLLTGDIEARAESKILARNAPGALRSRLLKLAHHGSKTSTSERFLDAVEPRIAIASAGRWNNYGHPAGEVLERCRRHSVAVIRTDRDGMIRIPLEPHGRSVEGAGSL